MHTYIHAATDTAQVMTPTTRHFRQAQHQLTHASTCTRFVFLSPQSSFLHYSVQVLLQHARTPRAVPKFLGAALLRLASPLSFLSPHCLLVVVVVVVVRRNLTKTRTIVRTIVVLASQLCVSDDASV